jgi:hypothetical protein
MCNCHTVSSTVLFGQIFVLCSTRQVLGWLMLQCYHDLLILQPAVLSDMSVTNKQMRFLCSRGSVLAFGTQDAGFKPRLKPFGFFKAQTKSSARLPFGGGSKSRPVPCRRFAACERTLKVRLIRYFQAKFTGHFSPNNSTFHC